MQSSTRRQCSRGPPERCYRSLSWETDGRHRAVNTKRRLNSARAEPDPSMHPCFDTVSSFFPPLPPRVPTFQPHRAPPPFAARPDTPSSRSRGPGPTRNGIAAPRLVNLFSRFRLSGLLGVGVVRFLLFFCFFLTPRRRRRRRLDLLKGFRLLGRVDAARTPNPCR